MMIITGLLTAILVVDCLFLILLVLVQLPKKEAGAGMAFGGAATDALFGAGSGTALTKITKYAAGIFFGLALILSIMSSQKASSSLEEKLKEKAGKSMSAPPPMGGSSAASAPSAQPLQNSQVTTPSAPTTPSAVPAEKPATSAPVTPESGAPAPK